MNVFISYGEVDIVVEVKNGMQCLGHIIMIIDNDKIAKKLFDNKPTYYIISYYWSRRGTGWRSKST